MRKPAAAFRRHPAHLAAWPRVRRSTQRLAALLVAWACGCVEASELVEIDAPPGPLGVAFGDDQRVAQVVASSPLAGKVRVGDRLLSLDGQSMEGFSGGQIAAKLLQAKAATRKLALQPLPTASASSEGKTLTVSAPAGALQIAFNDAGDIARVHPQSPLLGKVSVGDRLVSVDGVAVAGLSAKDVTAKLSASASKARSLVFRQATAVAAPSTSTIKPSAPQKLPPPPPPPAAQQPPAPPAPPAAAPGTMRKLIDVTSDAIAKAEAKRERCYYDAMGDGCPHSLGYDSKLIMCSCGYDDNTWFSVLGSFLWAFKQDASQRQGIAAKFGARLEGEGVISMDVGYTERLQCSEQLAQVWPGTNLQLDTEELMRLAQNLFYPQVRQKLQDLCVPGRVALQLLCLHAHLHGPRDYRTTGAYAQAIASVYPMIEGCVQEKTAFPFPGLGEYVKTLVNAEVSRAGGPSLTAEEAYNLAWWPGKSKLRGKRPEESEAHYWPCVPLQDKTCFPPGTPNLHMSCAHCCDPGRGPTGDAACFVGEFTFNRCCRTPGGAGRFY
eukprot:TRINITY_DN42917_c0_g1_i1.p1 TRINITY_DN42917_c0_g1~~TRINITY_DN42917_c0_g1_i1.p1  ORF type:complete len:552 (+),score=108.58 TRINITY_DN42917_c0_g1_i1:69-1724(+)